MIINSILLNRIKKLSETEPNNLTRRCAKFSEELGELSAACLAVDDPDGKNYKDLGVQDVKEESVDCLLMAFSTFFDPTIGGTIEELVELLSKKCDKWENTSHKGVGLNYQTLKEINESVKQANCDDQVTQMYLNKIATAPITQTSIEPIDHHDGWYDIDFAGMSKKELTSYLINCGFVNVNMCPHSVNIPILILNPTKRLFKFYHLDLVEWRNDHCKDKILCLNNFNSLSNFINVKINKVN